MGHHVPHELSHKNHTDCSLRLTPNYHSSNGHLTTLQVIWHFGGRELSPTSRRRMEERGSNYSLVLSASAVGEAAELGNYTCRASNKMGDGSDTVSLTGEKMGLIRISKL